MQIEYPLFLIPLEAGYVSVVDSESGHAPVYYLAIFTDSERAEQFMQACGIEGDPRPLHNAREFAWLVQSLHAPIANLAFDPLAESPTVEARWKVSAKELLANHVAINYSPWNYPVFVVEQAGGFACIEGKTSTGEEMRAIGLFTTREKADTFLEEANETGVVQQIDDMCQVRELLQHVSADANAVALDMTLSEGERSAQYCFSIKVVLEKYLVERNGDNA